MASFPPGIGLLVRLLLLIDHSHLSCFLYLAVHMHRHIRSIDPIVAKSELDLFCDSALSSLTKLQRPHQQGARGDDDGTAQALTARLSASQRSDDRCAGAVCAGGDRHGWRRR